ncbi:peptide deformylase [Candidatus Thorarchaeota archaeon]|nr:MAG: peptide deformylase [Candidatus Thorarchaeota archaeon]
MPVREILLLGNPKLHEISVDVLESEFDILPEIIQDLHDTIIEFRNQYGVGRAIAAPQINVMKRIIYMHTDKSYVFVNPVLKDLSTEMIELWDDCMCFPDLLVRVRRHRFCTIEYRDENWEPRIMMLKDDLSELLQHEYDHLDGILAVSRAIDGKSFSYRKQIQS